MAFKMNRWSAFTKEIDPVTGKERKGGKKYRLHKESAKVEKTKEKEALKGESPLAPQERSEYKRKQNIQKNIRKNTLKTNIKSEMRKYPPMQTAEMRKYPPMQTGQKRAKGE